MKKKIFAALALLVETLSAGAAELPKNRISDIPLEIQKCIILAASPQNRSLVKLTLDEKCYNTLTEEQKNLALKTLIEIQEQNFASVPEYTRGV